MGENPKVAAAVYAGGVFQCDWNGQEELLRQSDEKSAAAKEDGHDEGVKCIQPADVNSDDVHGGERDLGRQHYGRKDDDESEVSPLKFETCKSEGDETPGDKDADHVAEGHDRRVEEPPPRTGVAPEVCGVNPVG